MFGRLLMLMIVSGVVIGFALPTRAPAPQAPVQVAVVTPVAKPSQPIETVLNRADNGHFYVDAEVNGQLVHFVVDTGAAVVALTKADAQRIGLVFSPDQFTVVGRGASGDVRGQAITIGHIAIHQKEAFDVRGVVLDDGLDVSLLGQNFLSHIGRVTIDGDRMILK